MVSITLTKPFFTKEQQDRLNFSNKQFVNVIYIKSITN